MEKETKESLQVYCRIRPQMQVEPSCIKVISDTSVQLTLQDSNKSGKQYTFKKIFTDCSTQQKVFDEVALPLVEQLINGQNGLLFTYGVTGSGKTYTMTGNKQNVGVMPRCLDVLFNSITDFQAQKFIFKPDKMNGFRVQSEDEAERYRESYLRRHNMTKLKKNNSQEDLLSARSKDSTRISVKEEDNAYAVFITYVEVYNNSVYDLLDTAFKNDICQKPQLKIVREYGSGNMYVHGATEVEVKSTEEAFEMFYEGEKRKRMGCTTLNIDSSRSHSVFTIKLVQAPLNATGESVMQEKHMICVSQLSLVDLAGSERTNRTKNTGERLNETGKINQSLMVLRKCLETLRNNQQTGASNMVPYREHKITLLFKNFFEGDCDIRMIMCVNPRMADADENAFVMQFAEQTQDIMVKPTPLKTNEHVGLTPGRRRANIAFRKNLQTLEEVNENVPVTHVPIDANVICRLEYEIKKVSKIFEEKLISLNSQIERDLDKAKRDLDETKRDLECEKQKTRSLEQKLIKLNQSKRSKKESSTSPQTPCTVTSIAVSNPRHNEVNFEVRDHGLDHRPTMNAPLNTVCQRVLRKRKNLDNVTSPKEVRKTSKYCLRTRSRDQAGDKETQFFKDDVVPTVSGGPQIVFNDVETLKQTSPLTSPTSSTSPKRRADHRPTMITPLNTVCQPVLSKRKNFDNVTSTKEVRKTLKYCLRTRSRDQAGDIATQCFEDDVVPTVSGEPQIVFNDVETLKPTSPLTSPTSSTSPKRRAGSGNKKCEKCGKQFPFLSYLIRHKNIHHNNEKPFQCNNCGKSFVAKYYLTQHLQIHGAERKFKCRICQRAFKSSSNRSSHERTHEVLPRFICAICGIRYRCKNNLTKHLFQKH